jgi:glycine/D-amino acid oxidase-like deaminating enzyme
VKYYPYWWDTVSGVGRELDAGAAVDSRLHSKIAGPIDCDVAIIGAGYTGLAAARQLARRGASVVVLDREGIGWGASSRNGGQVLSGLKLDAAALVARYGERRARELFAAANDAIAMLEAVIDEERIDCEYRRCGHIQAAWKPSHFSAFRTDQALMARLFDHRVELVSRAGQRSEIGSSRYHGLLVDERSGCLNPAKYARGLAEAAVRAGARIATGTAVRAIERAPRGWCLRTEGGTTLTTREVLVATNGYTDRAAPGVQQRLVPVGSYIIATEPLDPRQACELLPTGRVAFDSKHFLFYFRVTGDSRLLFGGRAEFRRPDPASPARAARILARGLRTVFPQLEGTRIDYAWGGNVAFTRDQMPHAGCVDDVYYAGGYCGHGVAIATAFGDSMARRLCGEAVLNPLLDLECPRIPLYRGRPWFLPLVGASYKVKDWIS